jgi:hypothetical protein
MPTKSTKSIVRASSGHATPTAKKKRSPMPTKIESVAATQAQPPATPAAAAPAPAPVGFIQPPPKGTIMPQVPDDYVPAIPGEFASVVPRQAELSALPQAITDLGNFTDYAATLGATAPALDEVLESLGVGAQWSTVRQASTRFDGYASLQEGLSWRAIRTQLDTLGPAFALAAKRNPKLVVKYAGLAKLLGAKSAIALKGGATRRANNKAEAEGKPRVHGKVGKQRQRAAEKAALSTQATPVVATTVAATAPVAQQAAAPSPAPAAPSGNAPATAGTNGASHS